MRFSTSLLPASLTATVLLCSTLAAQPTLEWSAPIHLRRHYMRRHYNATIPDGLLLPVIRVHQIYPVVPSIFFERGSAEFSDRYVMALSPSDVAQFSDTTIPGGTMEKYHRTLGIIGLRMRRFPTAQLTITGCSSDDPDAGETIALARQRAGRVRDYLTGIFGIDPQRLTVTARRLPSRPSNNNDPMGQEENRRVEFSSGDPRITDLIHERMERWFHEPDTLALRVSNGTLDSQVVSRSLVITRAGRPWHTINLSPRGDTSFTYNWGYRGDADSLPLDTTGYSLRLILLLRDGRQQVAEAHVPVTVLENMDSHRPMEYTVDDYNLWLFPFDDARTTAFHRAVVERDVAPYLGAASQITVTGHTDVIGDEAYNYRLSLRRAGALAELIERAPRRPRTAYADVRGSGEDSPLYSNDYPEGRMLNRTVNVQVKSPRETK